jgi:hypothetical protein
LFELADIPAEWEYYSLFARQGSGENTRDWFPFAAVNEDGYSHFEAVTAADLASEQLPPWRDHLQVDESGAPTAVAPLKVESLSAGEADPDFGELVYQLTRGWTDVRPGDVTAGMAKRAVADPTVLVVNDIAGVEQLPSLLPE